MGNFFQSQQQQGAESLWNSAMSGQPIGANLVNNASNQAIGNVAAQTNQQLGTQGGDIMSRLSSMGGAPGSAGEGLVSRASQPVIAGEQNAIGNIGAQTMQQLSQMLMQQLSMGYQGLSSSSTFGDILAGLTTVGNLGLGVSKMGGNQGFNWWGGGGTNTTPQNNMAGSSYLNSLLSNANQYQQGSMNNQTQAQPY